MEGVAFDIVRSQIRTFAHPNIFKNQILISFVALAG